MPICPWPLDPACLTEEWTAFAPEIQERATLLASATLQRLSGYRVGACPITVRPCKKGCAGSWPSYYDYFGSTGTSGSFWPQNWSGVWINSCGCTGTDCACTALCEVELPGPVNNVSEVLLNGVEVDPDDYRVDSNRLVWTGDTECPWPTCQDLAAPDTAPGTFSITYLNAYPVDALASYAAGVLAVEFARACNGDNCRLPPGVTSVSRQGVSYEVASGAFPNGMSGIREVDAFIALWNPDTLREQPKVWFPGITSPRVTR